MDGSLGREKVSIANEAPLYLLTVPEIARRDTYLNYSITTAYMGCKWPKQSCCSGPTLCSMGTSGVCFSSARARQNLPTQCPWGVKAENKQLPLKQRSERVWSVLLMESRWDDQGTLMLRSQSPTRPQCRNLCLIYKSPQFTVLITHYFLLQSQKNSSSAELCKAGRQEW